MYYKVLCKVFITGKLKVKFPCITGQVEVICIILYKLLLHIVVDVCLVFVPIGKKITAILLQGLHLT